MEVLYQDESIWCTQKAMSILYDVTAAAINQHLKNIYAEGELSMEATFKKNLIVRQEGTRSVSRELAFYSLDAIISVGYRVNSVRATQFRQWATSVLRQFSLRLRPLRQQQPLALGL